MVDGSAIYLIGRILGIEVDFRGVGRELVNIMTAVSYLRGARNDMRGISSVLLAVMDC